MGDKGFAFENERMYDQPLRYELRENPFDGSVLCLSSGLFENPPRTIVIECDPRESRGDGRERYVFEDRAEYDRDGKQVGQEIAYFYSRVR